MGNLQFVGDAASVLNVLAGATGALAADRLAMIVELKRDPHDVVAFRLHEGGDDGGIDPAGHGDNDAGRGRRAFEVKTVKHWALRRNHE